MKEISNGELFADLQVSFTENVLVKLLKDLQLKKDFEDRLEGNLEILGVIRKIMEERFSDEDIVNFLHKGFPRRISFRKETP